MTILLSFAQLTPISKSIKSLFFHYLLPTYFTFSLQCHTASTSLSEKNLFKTNIKICIKLPRKTYVTISYEVIRIVFLIIVTTNDCITEAATELKKNTITKHYVFNNIHIKHTQYT